MTKKEYKKPAMQIVELKHRMMILAGSACFPQRGDPNRGLRVQTDSIQ